MLEQSEVILPISIPDSENRELVHAARLAELESAILATITYRDLFDYPVTAPEIHRYLHGVRCNLEDVQSALENRAFCKSYLATDGGFFALKGRDSLFDLRRQRKVKSGQLWKRALTYGSWLASLPFVKMIAVTGSLAVDNAGKGADIDFMLVTDGGRMWSVRLMAKILEFIDSKFSSGELCVNHLISTRALQSLGDFIPLLGAEEINESLYPPVQFYRHIVTDLRFHWGREFGNGLLQGTQILGSDQRAFPVKGDLGH